MRQAFSRTLNCEGMRQEADRIVDASIRAVLPDEAVKRALSGCEFTEGRLILIAVGKAAWQMARAACDLLGDRIDGGVVITKYGHIMGELEGLLMVEAGHPVPDENSFRGTQMALEAVSGLTESDTVVFLLSGGGSALFEKPLIKPKELERMTRELLAGGAEIREINTIRKRMSAVKGGRFARACAPARVVSVVLSDIIGDPLDMIASGPTVPDRSSPEEAKAAARKYGLTLTGQMEALLSADMPGELKNTQTFVSGSVRELAKAAAAAAESIGYRPVFLTDCLDCEAREAGRFLAAVAKSHRDTSEPLAFIAGGETVVHVKGNGKGGRNQEIAIAGGIGIRGVPGTAVFSFGSDGTDGPTDAAGGFVDATMIADAITVSEAEKALAENDAYPLLKRMGGLIITGPTGTNVNDVSVVLVRGEG